jgi:hypothetical protein
MQLLACSAQSATHSSTFPTMSNTPDADLQFERDPVSEGVPVCPKLQSDRLAVCAALAGR